MHLFLISAQVMEMIEKEQRDFVYEIFLFKRTPPLGLKACGGLGIMSNHCSMKCTTKCKIELHRVKKVQTTRNKRHC